MSFPCFSGIERRILGLLILFPFLGAMIFGTPYSYCVLTAISIMMGWELKSISGFLGFQGTLFASLIAISSLPFLVFGFSNQFEIAFTIAVLTSLFASTNCSLTVSIFAGFLSLCLSSSVAFLQIDEGNLKLVVLAIIIGASDSSAYFCGRFFGGPKLMPLVSLIKPSLAVCLGFWHRSQ